MKRIILILTVLLWTALTAMAQRTPVSQMERLGRGVIALPASGIGNFVSWRLLGTDDQDNTTFDVIRDGEVVASNLTVSNYRDNDGGVGSEYQIVTKVNGEATTTTAPVLPWSNQWLTLPLDRPAKGAQGGTYTPNDCSVGDVDGDGEYELFVKWDPSNAKDNSQDGYTDNVYIDCYKLDGTKLWRIDLGPNIRAGAHYTQFMVYDFDGDCKAEMMCKTAPGSVDGTGQYVNQAATDASIQEASNSSVFRNSRGRITGGQEYLTVFEGKTGKAIHTIFYNPNRNASYGGAADGSFNWGAPDGKSDAASYGNRGERYLAAVAHLDGPDYPASGIFCRGYYGYAFIWAVGFDGSQLYQKWLSSHKAKTNYSLTTYDADGKGITKSFIGIKPTEQSTGSGTMFANGNHNMSVADVDGNGRDEIIWGSAALNHDGTLLYGTGFGHGDAIHMGEMIPGREGLQVFQVHEEKGTYSWDLHDAATGEVIYKGGNAGVDNGRGMAAQLSTTSAEWWFSSGDDKSWRSAETGEVASTTKGSLNFRIYWNGTVRDQLFDASYAKDANDNFDHTTRVTIKTGTGSTVKEWTDRSTCNTTKQTPNLSADILGDWREEVVLWDYQNPTELYIHTTNTVTKYAVPTLMHDHTYRMGICWQNTAYNQPPHLGYNLALAMQPRLTTETKINAVLGREMTYTVKAKNAQNIMLYESVTPAGVTKKYGAPEGFTSQVDNITFTATLTGTPSEVGDYQFSYRLTGLGGESATQTLTIHVTEGTGIKGDVNGDNTVDVGDIMAVINIMAAGATDMTGDVNEDNTVDVGDIMAIINIMAKQ